MSLRRRSENRPTTTPVTYITAPREMYPSAATCTVLITLHAGTSANPIVAPITPPRTPNSIASSAIGIT